MIWATAKSTEVSSRHRPRPEAGRDVRAGRPGRGRRDDRRGRDDGLLDDGRAAGAGPVVGGRGRVAASRRAAAREVRLEILDVLEPDRHAQQARA